MENRIKRIFRGLLIVITLSVQIFGQANISDLVEWNNECKIIGGETNDLNYIFSSIRAIAVNSDSELFVIDGKGNHAKKYSNKGVFIENIGQEGKGPGDLLWGQAIALDSKNNIFVYDRKNKKIVEYNSDGNYKRTIKVYENIKNFEILKNGNIVALTSRLINKNNKFYSKNKLDIFSPEFKHIKNIDSLQFNLVTIQIDKTLMTVQGPFQSNLLWGTDSLSNIFVVNPSNYELKKYSKNGLKLLQNKYNSEKYYVSEKDIKQYFEEINVDENLMKRIKSITKFPDVKPFVTEMLVTEDGKLYLRCNKKNNVNELIDVFTSELKFQIQHSLPSTCNLSKSIVKNGLFFLVSSYDVDFPFVKICQFR